MSFGIGLGAFMDGFERGVGIRDKMDDRKQIKADKAALDQIETDTRAAFDEKVQAGEAKASEFDDFWKTYALPQRKMELMRQGDIRGAQALEEWGQSDAALKGGRLFTSAMLKAQTGDAAGALNDAIKAGQVKGYIEHGSELLGQDEIRDGAGNTVGYRLRVKLAGGKEVEQDIAVSDIPRLVATFANPDAAWASQQENRAAQAKRDQEMADYEDKKKIDKKYAAGEKSPNYEEAYGKARENRMKNDLDFADLSPEEQDAAVRKDLAAAEEYARSRGGATPAGPAAGDIAAPAVVPGGQPAPGAVPTPKIIVDETTGEIVPTAAPAPRQQAPAPNPNVPGLGTEAVQAPKGASKEQVIAEAADYIASGGNPEYIAQQLMNAGVAEGEWPTAVRTAMTRKQSGTPIGLGQ